MHRKLLEIKAIKLLGFIVFTAIAMLVIPHANAAYCIPPGSGNWIINGSCILPDNATINGNVTVQTGTLTIPANMSLTIPSNDHILITNSTTGGILIQPQGKLAITNTLPLHSILWEIRKETNSTENATRTNYQINYSRNVDYTLAISNIAQNYHNAKLLRHAGMLYVPYGNDLSNLTTTWTNLRNAGNITGVFYDNESIFNVNYTNQVARQANLAHSLGLTFWISPTHNQIVNNMTVIKTLPLYSDVINLQIPPVVTNKTALPGHYLNQTHYSGFLAKYNYTQAIANLTNTIHSVNPKTKVYVQIQCGDENYPNNMDALTAAIPYYNSVRNIVDGSFLYYFPGPPYCDSGVQSFYQSTEPRS